MAQRAQDLPSIVLLFGNIMGTSRILELSKNKDYEFIPPTEDSDDHPPNWRKFQQEVPAAPIFCLRFGENMYSPLGWRFGSSQDTDICDFQIAKDNKTSVSRKHFQIDLSPDTRNPRLTVLSKISVRVHVDEYLITLATGQTLEILQSIKIDLGEITFSAWRPALTTHEERIYRQNVENFSREFLDALPNFAVSLKDTTTSTFDLRYGRNDTVYKQIEPDCSRGSFASVMKVKELRSQTIFAAKVPHFKHSDSANIARRRWELLTAEYSKILSLRHPCIVSAIDVLRGSRQEEPPWLIMEWIEHDLAASHLDESNIPIVLLDICKGLAYMHSRGFTHRDLKPENILIAVDNGRVAAKIADFGATKFDISGQMQTYTGTNIYMAPEFWMEKLAYSNAVDLWSFGVIAIELLTEWEAEKWSTSLPPSRDQHKNWIRRVLRPRIDIAREEMTPLLTGALAETPDERWTAAQSEIWLHSFIRTRRVSTGGTEKQQKRIKLTPEDSHSDQLELLQANVCQDEEDQPPRQK